MKLQKNFKADKRILIWYADELKSKLEWNCIELCEYAAHTCPHNGPNTLLVNWVQTYLVHTQAHLPLRGDN